MNVLAGVTGTIPALGVFMAFADQDTGTPAAVTAETLERWKKLAHDITAALNQGVSGEWTCSRA